MAPGAFLHLGKVAGWVVGIGVGLHAFFALFFPLGQLGIWAFSLGKEILQENIFSYILDTAMLATACGLLITLISLFFVFLARFYWSSRDRFLSFFLKLGYAFPGVIVGVGVMAFFSFFKVNFFGSIAYLALVYGLLIRFYSIGWEIQDNACALIKQRFDWSAQSLGLNSWRTFFRVHLVLLRPAIFSSFILCFLEVAKEMPITLILRPYNFNTLSSKIYELTSEGEWEKASLYSILLMGLASLTLILNEYFKRESSRRTA